MLYLYQDKGRELKIMNSKPYETYNELKEIEKRLWEILNECNMELLNTKIGGAWLSIFEYLKENDLNTVE